MLPLLIAAVVAALRVMVFPEMDLIVVPEAMPAPEIVCPTKNWETEASVSVVLLLEAVPVEPAEIVGFWVLAPVQPTRTSFPEPPRRVVEEGPCKDEAGATALEDGPANRVVLPLF
jgi:hypothetical protein